MGHKIELLAVALTFIAFSLVVSFVAPRYRPNFPGKGLSVFIVVCFALFASMMGAIVFLAKDQPESAHAAAGTSDGARNTTIETVETEYRIALPSNAARGLVAAEYTFHVVNKGKQPHNLEIVGPGLAKEHTKNLAPGESADLRVRLAKGAYDLYCSIPGHKQLGMDAKLSVG